MIEAEPNLSALLHNNHRARLEREILPSYLRTCRWFGAKARSIREMRIIEQIPVAEDAGQLWLLQVAYTDGAPDIYSMPVQLETGPAAEALARTTPQAVIARVGDKGVLYDALWDPEFREKIFQLMASGAILKGRSGQLVGLGAACWRRSLTTKRRPPRCSTPNRATRRCFSTTGFSSSSTASWRTG